MQRMISFVSLVIMTLVASQARAAQAESESELIARGDTSCMTHFGFHAGVILAEAPRASRHGRRRILRRRPGGLGRRHARGGRDAGPLIDQVLQFLWTINIQFCFPSQQMHAADQARQSKEMIPMQM